MPRNNQSKATLPKISDEVKNEIAKVLDKIAEYANNPENKTNEALQKIGSIATNWKHMTARGISRMEIFQNIQNTVKKSASNEGIYLLIANVDTNHLSVNNLGRLAENIGALSHRDIPVQTQTVAKEASPEVKDAIGKVLDKIAAYANTHDKSLKEIGSIGAIAEQWRTYAKYGRSRMDTFERIQGIAKENAGKGGIYQLIANIDINHLSVNNLGRLAENIGLIPHRDAPIKPQTAAQEALSTANATPAAKAPQATTAYAADTPLKQNISTPDATAIQPSLWSKFVAGVKGFFSSAAKAPAANTAPKTASTESNDISNFKDTRTDLTAEKLSSSLPETNATPKVASTQPNDISNFMGTRTDLTAEKLSSTATTSVKLAHGDTQAAQDGLNRVPQAAQHDESKQPSKPAAQTSQADTLYQIKYINSKNVMEYKKLEIQENPEKIKQIFSDYVKENKDRFERSPLETETRGNKTTKLSIRLAEADIPKFEEYLNNKLAEKAELKSQAATEPAHETIVTPKSGP